MIKLADESSKVEQVQLLKIPLSEITPSPENDRIYKPIDPESVSIEELADSIAENGLLEHIVVTNDRYIVSGHRRFAACNRVGLRTVPCRVLPIDRGDDIDAFVKLLREFNRQREKTRAERIREEVIDIDPWDAYCSLIAEREEAAKVEVATINVEGETKRKAISKAKWPMLEAIKRIVNEQRDYWPLSDRRIHYALLNDPPLKHASKPDSVYKNDHASYRATVDLVVRARLTGEIPMTAIGDETRPVINWKVDNEIGSFVRRELDGFLKGYWRDVMQSQPNHIEIIGEKNTVAPMLERVAMKYRLPLTTGRGYCSLPPRFDMAERFRKSGKSKLVLLIVSDHDPDGEEIAQSFARSMRDDFGIDDIHPVKVALTAKQAADRGLPPNNDAKRSSPNYKKFFKRHQTQNAYELEALQPSDLQQILTDAIDSVIDTDAFNEELRAEEADATELAKTRQLVQRAITALDLE